MRYILLFGGELRNKGAQAMTFVAVDELAKRYPNHRVVLVSSGDAKRPQEEKDNYRFEIRSPLSGKQYLILSNAALTAVYRKTKKDKAFDRWLELYQNTDGILDISGFALGQSWGTGRMITFAMPILAAKRFGIPVNIMPQSFGPFAFRSPKEMLTKALLKQALGYAHVVMAREHNGEICLRDEFQLSNVVKATDLVLQNRGIDPKNVYVTPPAPCGLTVAPNSIAIIPNKKNDRFGTKQELLDAYRMAVQAMLDKGKHVYLLYHALEDRALCKEIKEMFSQEGRVVNVEQELSCLEFDSLVEKFDFVLASRFHSVVHAYKNNVPAVILGWAVKYRELAACVGQENCQFDVRKGIDPQKLTEAVTAMDARFPEESGEIAEKMVNIRKQNVFDWIKIRESNANG